MNIEELINDVVNQDFSKAGATFKDIMSDRMSDALEQEKIAVADTVFNNQSAESDDEEFEDDFTDEELEDAAEEFDEE